jgi:hypothetical protein
MWKRYAMAYGTLLGALVVMAFLWPDLSYYFGQWNNDSSAVKATGVDESVLLLSAPTNNVYFLLVEGSQDDVAAEIVYAMCRNQPQYQLRYTLNDSTVDVNGCPRPDVIGKGKSIVLFGGPRSELCVQFYETSKQTPTVMGSNETYVWWETREGEIVGESARAELDEHHDVFVIEFFVDDYGRDVLICYGYGPEGTLAAGIYFREVISRRVAEYKQPYCLYGWVDTNNNGVPELSEIRQKLPAYICVQATLHSAPNRALVEWFARTCHSKELKITWYIEPNALDDSLVKLLEDYVSSGDAVELSFGPVFFNEMSPEDRLVHVDSYMDAFKRLFGHYPEMVEAHYVDAYTLYYISLRYPSVKGGVTYVNHETYLDGFKSAGTYYMPYYPSRQNAVVPGTGQNKIDFVAFPFLQRDITNCILYNSNLFNLDPQDGKTEVVDWRPYFTGLLRAYTSGWDQFGLVLYMIDLTYPTIPVETIAEDLAEIQSQLCSGNQANVLDREFASWFKTIYAESPSYRWSYIDPLSGSFSSCWYFTPQERLGYLDGRLIDSRTYDHKYEDCYAEAFSPYDNSAT